MKKNIMLSIQPEYVEKIVNGNKKYEYRKQIAKQEINKIIIYESYPIKKIVAEATVEETIVLPKEELWNKTKDFSGITKEYYDSYFRNRKIAYAYKLGKVEVYDKPKQLKDFGLNYAPQSFVYV